MLSMCAMQCCSQQVNSSEIQRIYVVNNANDFNKIPKTCVLQKIERFCKEINFIFIDTATYNVQVKSTHNVIRNTNEPKLQKPPFISIHGNVMYDFFYQSHLDTPFIGNDLYQHTVTTFLDVRIKGNYPLRVYFTSHFSNSNYLKNINNINFQFTPQTFLNIIREKLVSYAQQAIDSFNIDSMRSLLSARQTQLLQLKDWINSEAILQKLVEAKEALYAQQFIPKLVQKTNDSINNKSGDNIAISERNIPWTFLSNKFQDSFSISKSAYPINSAAHNLMDEYSEKKKKIDSLQSEVIDLQQKVKSVSDSINKYKYFVNEKINTIKNQANLKEQLQKYSVPDSALPKGYKTLMAIQKLSIGTTTLDYSELSAKNITVTGLQIEYNPRFYYALAGGVINYRFRDYLLPEKVGPKQYLGLVRFGKQAKNGNSLILTYYFGRKMLYNYYTTDSLAQVSFPIPNFNLNGITLENKIKINEHSYLVAEIAKSSLPYYHSISNKKGITGTFNFSDHSNEAYSLKINTEIPVTNTKIEGYFKHFGANFQSFTLLSTSSEQNAWSVRVSQEIFKKQLLVTGSIRKNDFIDPFLNQRYVNNTIFKSIQATLRIRSLPVISVGFFPVTQLTKINDDTYSESLFYTFTATVSHFYNQRHTAMSTILTYTRFYNKPFDTAFTYYNTRNIMLAHSVFLKNLTIQNGFSAAINNDYHLWSLNENVQWKCSQWLNIGGGIKYNKQSLLNNSQIGYEINTTVKVNKIGTFQVRASKTFIPGIDRQLVPNNIGRVTYYKTF